MLFFACFLYTDIIKDNKDITGDSGFFFMFCHLGLYYYFQFCMIKMNLESTNEIDLIIIHITVATL